MRAPFGSVYQLDGKHVFERVNETPDTWFCGFIPARGKAKVEVALKFRYLQRSARIRVQLSV